MIASLQSKLPYSQDQYRQTVGRHGDLVASLTNAASISKLLPEIFEMQLPALRGISKDYVKNPTCKITLENAWISALRNPIKPERAHNMALHRDAFLLASLAARALVSSSL